MFYQKYDKDGAFRRGAFHQALNSYFWRMSIGVLSTSQTTGFWVMCVYSRLSCFQSQVKIITSKRKILKMKRIGTISPKYISDLGFSFDSNKSFSVVVVVISSSVVVVCIGSVVVSEGSSDLKRWGIFKKTRQIMLFCPFLIFNCQKYDFIWRVFWKYLLWLYLW